MGAVAWLQLREILSGKKLWLAGLLAAFPVALSGLVAYAGGWEDLDPEIERFAIPIYLFILHPMLTGGLLSLLYGTSIVNSDLERRTITYLFTRPLAKWKVVAAKYGAVTGFLAAPTTTSFLLSWALLGGPGGARVLAGMELAVLGAVSAYTALFAAIGSVFRGRPLIAGIVYAFVVEGVLSFVPALVNTVTVSYYLRSMVARALDLDLPPEFARLVGGASLLQSLGVLLAVAAAALGLAAVAVTRREPAASDAP